MGKDHHPAKHPDYGFRTGRGLELTIARDQDARKVLEKKLTVVHPDIAAFKAAINYNDIQLVSSEKARDLIKRLLAIQ